MKSLLNKLVVSCVIGSIGMSVIGKVDAQSSAPPAQTEPATTQNQPSPSPGAQRGGARRQCVEQLNLTSSQRTQLQAIRKDSISRQEKKQKLTAILSPEQKQKLEQCIRASRQGSADRNTEDQGL